MPTTAPGLAASGRKSKYGILSHSGDRRGRRACNSKADSPFMGKRRRINHMNTTKGCIFQGASLCGLADGKKRENATAPLDQVRCFCCAPRFTCGLMKIRAGPQSRPAFARRTCLFGILAGISKVILIPFTHRPSLSPWVGARGSCMRDTRQQLPVLAQWPTAMPRARPARPKSAGWKAPPPPIKLLVPAP